MTQNKISEWEAWCKWDGDLGNLAHYLEWITRLYEINNSGIYIWDRKLENVWAKCPWQSCY